MTWRGGGDEQTTCIRVRAWPVAACVCGEACEAGEACECRMECR